MEGEDVYQTVKKLIGPIEPIGDTWADEGRWINLQAMTYLVGNLLLDISKVARHKGRVEFSMARAGEHADKFKKEFREKVPNDTD
ncbi:MAG TPA: hypothetical protein V6D12_14000 [Candidatus Obscuribacterales bacterium]